MPDQRAHTERRRSFDRRRTTSGRTAAIEICHSVLRVAIITPSDGQEPRNVATRTVPWRKEATSFHSARATEELTNAFRTLVAEEKLTGTKLRIALGGEICVTRVISGAADFVRRETSQLEERSQRYLSLGAGQKAIAANVQQLDARHQHALLTVTNQKTLDMLVHVVETVGVQIELVEPSLVAICRAIEQTPSTCDEPVLVIHLDERSVEIGICHHGMLLLDYCPSGKSAVRNVGQIVREHLSRLQRYCSRNYLFLDKPLRKLLVSGDPTNVARTVESFGESDVLEAGTFDAGQIELKWRFADGMPGSDFAAALGTAITCLPEAHELDPSGPNLMEDLIAQARTPMRPVLIRSFLPLVAVLLIAAFIFGANQKQNRENAALKRQLDELAPAQVKTTELRLKRQSAEHRLKHLRSLEIALAPKRWAALISSVGHCMPHDVWLDRMSIRDSHDVLLAGASYADSGIYELVRFLETAPGFDNVALEGTRPGQTSNGPSTDFDIELILADFDDYEKR